MHILCLCGWSNAGKDTVASLLQKQGYQQFAFANPLKDSAARQFGFPREWADSQVYKNFYWKYAGEIKTIRQYLIDLAIHQKEKYGPTIYVDSILDKLKELPEDSKIVISDLRYPEEYNRILEVYPEAQIWRIIRLGQTKSPVSDVSEYYHLQWKINGLIHNSGTDLEDLENEILKMLSFSRNELPTP